MKMSGNLKASSMAATVGGFKRIITSEETRRIFRAPLLHTPAGMRTLLVASRLSQSVRPASGIWIAFGSSAQSAILCVMEPTATSPLAAAAASQRRRGWVLYDAECAFCTRWMARLEKAIVRRQFQLAPLQTPWVNERLGLAQSSTPDEIKLLTVEGSVFGGADALIYLARLIWWAWPVYLLARLPGAKPLLRAAYRAVARRRHCLSGGCKPRLTPDSNARSICH